jgi:hypothetical protein
MLAMKFLAAALVAVPALATAQMQDTTPVQAPSPASEAVSAQTAPGVAAANADAAAEANLRGGMIKADNVGATAVYARDMAAYRTAVRRHNRTLIRDQVRYDRQQRAYADAMAVWRDQVAACKRGSARACRAPTPDPAAFY